MIDKVSTANNNISKKNPADEFNSYRGKVKQAEDKTRLDLWLKKRLQVSRKQAKRFLDDGFVTVNGKRTTLAGFELHAGVEIELSRPRTSKLIVLFEDRDLLIINKPAFMLSVPVPGSLRVSAEEAAHKYMRGKYQESKGSFIRPLHRLDSGTSGAMIFARSNVGMRVMDLFRQRQIDRKYIAVVKGHMQLKEGRIDKPISKGSFGRGKRADVGKGKESLTTYRVLEIYRDATLLEITAHSGRTHQIRAHLADIGHPLIGDKIYGVGEGFRRPALHAFKVVFHHPATGKKIDVEAKMPPDMQGLINKLRG